MVVGMANPPSCFTTEARVPRTVGLTLTLIAVIAFRQSWPPPPPPPVAASSATFDASLLASDAATAMDAVEDSLLLRCPPGRYSGVNATADANTRLLAHWRRLRALGYRPRRANAAAARRAAERGFITYESPLWPRPAHCFARKRERRRTLLDEPPGTCEPAGVVCDKYRLSRKYRFVWHHVWKGGTTSLSPWLTCNMKAEPIAGLLRRLPAPLPGYLHVGTARAPLPRFLSAFQEVFARVRLGRVDADRVGAPQPRCLTHKVPWLVLASELQAAGAATAPPASIPPLRPAHSSPAATAAACADPQVPLSESALRAVFRQFVADVECSAQYPNVEHLYTQSLFLGGNTSTPQPLDMLLRLETLDADLRVLKRAVGYQEAADACPLKVERVAAGKPKAVPTAAALASLLRDEPGLLQRVCNVYMIDFVCLGYPLPEGCEMLPRKPRSRL